MRIRWLSAIALALGLLLVALAGCTGGGESGTSGAATTGTAAPGSTGASANGSPPKLTGSGPCQGVTGFTCSTLSVPLDHSGRVGGRLDLKVAARDDAGAPRGVLVLLTGGPGQPGVPFVPRLSGALAPQFQGYRLVMLDQRGTGAAALQCPALQRAMGSSDRHRDRREAALLQHR
jgi:hypothetical protein